MLQAPRHAHQAGHIKRHESEMEADEPAPERRPAPALVEREAERLGEPIYVTGEDAEYDARDDDVMEMGNQERAVVHLPINGGHGEQHARQAAQDGCHHEADQPQDWHGGAEPSARTPEPPLD